MKVTPEKSPEYHLQIFSCLSAPTSLTQEVQVPVIHSKQIKKGQKSGPRQSEGSTADILQGFALRILVQNAGEERGKVIEQTAVTTSRQENPNNKTESQGITEKNMFRNGRKPWSQIQELCNYRKGKQKCFISLTSRKILLCRMNHS